MQWSPKGKVPGPIEARLRTRMPRRGDGGTGGKAGELVGFGGVARATAERHHLAQFSRQCLRRRCTRDTVGDTFGDTVT